MRFNTHCHVFNLQSVFTEGTAFILEKRLKGHGISDEAVQDFVKTLKKYIAHGGGLDDVGLDHHAFSESPRSWLGIAKEVMQALHLALLKNMDLVTDDMVLQFPHVDSDVAFVPLMMDILIEQQTEAVAGDIFDNQVAGTLQQILRYPGRILPFYAVNPFRYEFVGKTQKALDSGGFVGMKLYPSLGYDLDAPGMDEVFQYCNKNDIPVLMHCNDGGFKQDSIFVPNCDPKKWGKPFSPDGYLEKYQRLKICFAHFGGQENFVSDDGLTNGSWTHNILEMMREYPGRVFADVAYHSAALDENTRESYFHNLGTILSNPRYRTQVLWGTDTWMLRMVSRELAFWGAFMPRAVTQDDFARMCSETPQTFLGIDAAHPKHNILNHMSYLRANVAWTKAQAQEWLNKAAS